ncbi:MAG: hypothetical protein LBH43_17595 [Treponema sp.]|jgi:hypothetical protein|nr:hypothetical protein [Treponema sp.]
MKTKKQKIFCTAFVVFMLVGGIGKLFAGEGIVLYMVTFAGTGGVSRFFLCKNNDTFFSIRKSCLVLITV